MTRSLRILPLALGAVLVAPGAVAAHAELTSTTPEAGAELDQPPTEVVLIFDDELQPEGSGFTVAGPGGTEVGSGEVDLEVATRNELRGAVEINEPGDYVVAWSAVAADGHAEEGSFTFTVTDPDEPPAPNPDTAVPVSPGPSGLLLAGIGLLSAAVLRLARLRAR